MPDQLALIGHFLNQHPRDKAARMFWGI